MKKLAALVGAGLLLAACSTDPSSAAVVNGEEISIDDLSQVQVDFREQGTNTLAGGVLNLLIQAEIAYDIIEEQDLDVPEEYRDLVMTQLGVTDSELLSQQTDEMITYLAFTVATQDGLYSVEQAGPVINAIIEADVDVNPRFGEWDGDNLSLVSPTYEYLTQETVDQTTVAGF